MTKAEDTRGSVAGAPAAKITLVEGGAGKADTAAALRRDRDAIRRIFETGEYPYKQKLTRKVYEQHKAELQVELLKVLSDENGLMCRWGIHSFTRCKTPSAISTVRQRSSGSR